MARGLNKVLLIGNLGKDPEMKYTPQGKPVATFSLAVSRSWKGNDGELRDETEWFRIVAWDKLAETCNEYLRKGSKVYIEGRLQTRKWEGQDGQPRETVEVVAFDLVFLEPRQGAGVPGGSRSASGGSAEDRGSRAPSGGSYSNGFDDDADTDADDIPF
jgi:single-strand DNA-binding protein